MERLAAFRVRDWWPVLALPALGVAALCGRTIASGPGLLVVIAVLVLVATLFAARPLKVFVQRRIGDHALAIEVPILLLLMSTLVWRTRSADALAYDPLDRAAIVRVLCIALALMLGGAALISPHRPGATPRRRLTTLPFRIYTCYVGVVVLGAPGSLKPFLTSYRAVELLAGIVVLLGAYQALGNAATRRIENTIYWFTVALISSVWVGRFIDPSAALIRPADTVVPLKWELVGIVPNLAANSVGALGLAVAVWSLARYMNHRRYRGSRRVALAFTIVGIVTVIAAQYRTGYIAFTAAFLVVCWLRRRVLFVVLSVAVVLVLALWPNIVTNAEPYVLRGQTTKQAQQLTGRVDYWSHAIPVWRESPIIGRGLWTASRYEVLAPLGLDTTASVHSTWVEALVGTGVVGLSLLLSCVLIALRRAWRAARAGPRARIGPLALLVALTVRSLTGNLFESFGHEQLIFLAIALALEDPIPFRAFPPPVSSAARGTAQDPALDPVQA